MYLSNEEYNDLKKANAPLRKNFNENGTQGTYFNLPEMVKLLDGQNIKRECPKCKTKKWIGRGKDTEWYISKIPYRDGTWGITRCCDDCK